MKFFLRTVMPLLSLAISLVALVFAAHSHPHDDKWEFSTLRAHYTVWSKHGSVIVMGPPPATWNATEARAWDSLKRLENTQFQFTISYPNDVSTTVESEPIPGTAAAELAAAPQSLIIRPLLRGLDGPKKFAAADLLLEGQGGVAIVTNSTPQSLRSEPHIGGYAFRAAASPPQLQTSAAGQLPASQPTVKIDSKSDHPPFVDPAQRDIRRRYWHDRLDVQMFRLGYFWIVVGNLVLPAIQVATRFAHRKKQNNTLPAS